MKKLKQIGFFEELLKTPNNELVKKAINQGRTAVGFNCYVVPEALLSTGNLFPVWMTAPDVVGTAQADYYMANTACSYCRSLLEAGIDGTFDFLGAAVFSATCDHIRRGGQYFEVLKIGNQNENFAIHMLDAPFKHVDYTVKWYAVKLRKLADEFNTAYNANINDDTLRKSINEFNEFNELMQSIGDFRKAANPKITGTEWHKIYGASKVAPKDLLIAPLKKIKAEIESREADVNDLPRLMIVGSTFDKPEFTELIEAQGAIVVADRYCFGSLPGMEPIKVDGDPFENIAEYYLGTCMCPRMMQKTRNRIEYSEGLAKEYNIDGIIFEKLAFCDLWSYEGVIFPKRMKESNIPNVTIEREYALTGEGQLRTRIQAFIESIKNKQEINSFNK